MKMSRLCQRYQPTWADLERLKTKTRVGKWICTYISWAQRCCVTS